MQLRRAMWVGAVLGTWPAEAAADGGPGKESTSAVTARAAAHTALYADTDHVTVVTPVVSGAVTNPVAGWSAEGHYLVDVISAASVDIVSTASRHWTEVRHAGAVSVGYAPHDLGAHASVALSREPDYASIAGGGVVTWDFAEKSHTLFLGYARDHDTIGRSGTAFDVFSHTLDVDTLNAGVTFTLNASTALSLMSDLALEHGDQSKPYRYIPMFDAAVAPTVSAGEPVDVVNTKRLQARPLEQLPESRQRYSLTARFGHRFDHGTLRVDERLYTDSWSLHASTTEIRFYADVSRRLTVYPRARFHVQDSVYFWRRAYVASFGPGGTWTLPSLRTGDRELGPLTTLGVGLGGSFAFGPAARPSAWTVVLQLDGMRTAFLDDLYVTARSGVLTTLGVEGVFE